MGVYGRGRVEPPGQPHHEEKVAPMFGVDLDSLEQGCQQWAEDGDGLMAQGRRGQDGFPAHRDRRQDEQKEADAAQPAVGGKSVDKHVVGIVAENLAKLHRAHAIGQAQQQGQAVELITETAGFAGVIVIDQIGALLKNRSDAFEGEREGDEGGRGKPI
jgi:hypothetical protein